MQVVNVMWFRRDLRLEDNQALFEAAQSEYPILPIFIIDPWFYSWAEVGKMRVRFMFESLQNLHQNLISIGSQLTILEGNSEEILNELQKILLRNNYQPRLYFNQDVQTEYGKKRDNSVSRKWNQNQSNSVYQGQAYFLLQDESKMDGWREEYDIYQQAKYWPKPLSIKTDQALTGTVLQLPHLSLIDLKNKYGDFANQQSELFYGGETRGHEVLNSFLESRFVGYHWKLSRPHLAQLGSTSQLSPHLMFGTISPRQVYQQTIARIATIDITKTPKAELSLTAFLDRMRWRDSFTQRFWFHPEYGWKNRFPEFDIVYSEDRTHTNQEQEYLEKWQNGQTGFPLVDASMRQLRTQGWMNFRMRAMCATFLTINCNVPWQLGARHFMNYLVDGDMCINAWQWQMQAGVTNPLSPSFRIYNPTKNISEKDPNLKYIHHWVPELKGFNLEQILNGDYLGKATYPKAMLDFVETKKINGKVISDLRKQVRARVREKLGLPKPEPKPKIKRQPIVKKIDPRQIDLFEEGNG